MKFRIATLAVVSLFAVLIATPARIHGQQASPAGQHELQHPGATPAEPGTARTPADTGSMMERMKAENAKLDALVKKMNAANGPEKTEAMAELLTALVDHQAMCESMMANMPGMMHTMGPHAEHDAATPAK